MLGVILNSVVDAVRYKRGSRGIDELKKSYGKSITFQDLTNYPDGVLLNLVVSALKITGYEDMDEFQRFLAPFIIKSLQRKFPNVAKKCTDTYSTLVAVEGTHMSISPIENKKKVILVDKDDSSKTLTLKYQSPNKLDALFDEFILLVARTFHERVDLKYISKMSEGSDSTVVKIRVY
jgi:hypothetical protein